MDPGFLVVLVVILAVSLTSPLSEVSEHRYLDRVLWGGDRDARPKAKAAYHASLLALANDPRNPELRHGALELGRAYSRLMRRSKSVTIFDEIALSNDINAVSGGTLAIAPPGDSQYSTGTPTMEDRLAQLARAKERGLISDAEYTAKRKQVLDEV